MDSLTVCVERAKTLADLHAKTIEFYENVTRTHGEDTVASALLSPEDSKRVEDIIRQRPCVVVLGEKNCGKSSLINQLLGGGQNVVPSRDTPCTSRLVRIKYSSDPYSRLLDKHGNEREVKRGSKLYDIKKWIELEADSRYDQEEISLFVEAARDKVVLKSGLEIIDSPGFGENHELDQVIFGLLEREPLLPLFIYVIDANQRVRNADRENVKRVREKCPNATILYICNKVDQNLKAREMDEDVDEESGEKNKRISKIAEKLSDEEVDKMKAVYQILQHEGMMQSYSDGSDDVGAVMNLCRLFHGLSCRNVKRARRLPDGGKGDAFLDMFGQLESKIGQLLQQNLNKLHSQATAILLCSYDKYLRCYAERCSDLTREVKAARDLMDGTQQAEFQMFNLLNKLVESDGLREKLEKVVLTAIDNVKSDVFFEAQSRELPDKFEYQAPDLLFLYTESIKKMIESLHDPKLIEVNAFCKDICDVIINKVSNEVGRKTVDVLKQEFPESVQRVSDQISMMENTVLFRHSLEKAYTLQIDIIDQTTKKRELASVLEQLATTLSGGIDIVLRANLYEVYSAASVRKAVQNLQKTLKKKDESHWRTEIANELLANLNPSYLASGITQTCKTRLTEVHNAFTVSHQQLTTLNNELAKLCEKQNTEMRYLDVPKIADLKVKTLALEFGIKYGELRTGHILGQGSRCEVNACKFADNWPRPSGDLAIKVVTLKDRCGQRKASWDYMVVTLHDIRSIKPQDNLLVVHGWIMPRPDELYIAVDRAKTDLYTRMKEVGLDHMVRIQVALDVANGLKALHDQGIIYGDLKPQNVLVKFDESSGWSALINTCKPEAIFAQTTLGEPFHIAPYLYEGSGERKIFGDVYAFGMLLWFLCDSHCRRPDVYDSYTTRETMKIAVTERGIRPNKPNQCNQILWELMQQCWSEEKPITVDDIIQRLSALVW
ncbi:dual serine/threonine and tyrosine protein kinase-like [Ptychodera flava]|uniref:dual serine/threonine and tyrosine protein kinase-like n=1 Tax=Ptychodera flava TaxID=63121 RepID=UPI00396A9023